MRLGFQDVLRWLLSHWCIFSLLYHRSTRTNAGRKKFKVDSLLDRLEQKIKDSGSQEGLPLGGYMTITFLGYYDSKKSAKMLDGTISAELLLLKTGHKKRKETPFLMESAGSVEIPCNPSEDHPPNKAPALSVSCESLTTSNGHQVTNCHLSLKYFLFKLVAENYRRPMNYQTPLKSRNLAIYWPSKLEIHVLL